MWDEKSEFSVEERTVTLYHAECNNAPLIIINDDTEDGSGIIKAMKDIHCRDCNVAAISGIDWDHDLTPWYCPPLVSNGNPCTGGADEYLNLLLNKIIPKICDNIQGEPEFTGLTGYSLGGLFSIYAMYRTDYFSRIASASGSLWFPAFKEFAESNEVKRKPDRLYISLGDKEARSRNKMLRLVQENTEALVQYYKDLGIHTEYELNQGNHFKDAELRLAKGIAAISETLM